MKHLFSSPDTLRENLVEAISGHDLKAIKNILKNKKLIPTWVDENNNSFLHLAVNELMSSDQPCEDDILNETARCNNSRENFLKKHNAEAENLKNIAMVMINFFVNNEIPLDKINSSKETSLMIAAERGCAEIIEVLMTNKANPNLVDENLNTPFGLAVTNKRVLAVKSLLHNNVEPITNKRELSDIIPKDCEEEIRSLMIEAFKKNCYQHPNINFTDQMNMTKLLWAADEGNLLIVKKCIREGANVNHVNNNVGTALFKAAKNSHIEIVRELLLNGADPTLYKSIKTGSKIINNLITQATEVINEIKAFNEFIIKNLPIIDPDFTHQYSMKNPFTYLTNELADSLIKAISCNPTNSANKVMEGTNQKVYKEILSHQPLLIKHKNLSFSPTLKRYSALLAIPLSTLSNDDKPQINDELNYGNNDCNSFSGRLSVSNVCASTTKSITFTDKLRRNNLNICKVRESYSSDSSEQQESVWGEEIPSQISTQDKKHLQLHDIFNPSVNFELNSAIAKRSQNFIQRPSSDSTMESSWQQKFHHKNHQSYSELSNSTRTSSGSLEI